MNRELEILVEMQKKDDIIGQKQVLTKTLPEQLNSLRTNLIDSEAELTDVKHQLEENLKDQKLNELKIAENNDKIAKYKNQLLTIKTNKEYKALNSEISHLETNNSLVDDEIIEQMEAEAELRENLQTATDKYKSAQDEFKANEERLKNRIKEVEQQIVNIREERNKIAQDLPITMIKRYGALIKHKARKAVVFKINEACGGCGYKIRPQLVIEIDRRDKLINCENCGRILVYEPQNIES
jgi:uncharacterized protein